MTCCSCFQNSCPETVPVTITQTIIQVDGATSFFVEDHIVYADLASPYNVLTLSSIPYQNASVGFYRNSSLQRQGVDYSVSGGSITLVAPAVAGEEFVARYFSVGATVLGAMAVGSIIGYDLNPGEDAPSGWLKMDGVTAWSKALYPTLWTYLSSHTSLLASSDALTFTLISSTSPVIVSGTLTNMQSIIKT